MVCRCACPADAIAFRLRDRQIPVCPLDAGGRRQTFEQTWEKRLMKICF
jgi:hypothetical protein